MIVQKSQKIHKIYEHKTTQTQNVYIHTHTQVYIHNWLIKNVKIFIKIH